MVFSKNFNQKNFNWINDYKNECIDLFDEKEMLSKKSEYWRFAPANIWYDKIFYDEKLQKKHSSHKIFELNDANDFIIKFKDGILDTKSVTAFKQKVKGIKVCSYNEAIMDGKHWSRSKFGTAHNNAEKPYKRPLALFNGLAAEDGLFLKCEKNLKKPIHIFYEGKEIKKSIIRNLFIIEEGIKLRIIEHFNGNSKYNVLTEFFTDKNSSFEHNKLVNLGMSETIIYHLFGNCEASSNIKSVNFSFSNYPVRNEINLFLEGSKCDATIASLGFGKNVDSINDNTFFISHEDESCKSRQIVKNALSDGAKAIFQGKIFVSPKAQKTDGYQMSNGLILTDNCEFLVKPELEIYADDVVCSHGSISGTLNSDHLFYLQSRGIPILEAQKKLIQAFFEEIIDEIDDEKIVFFIQSQISRMLT